MKFNIKSFAAGAVVMLVGVSVVYAAGGIKSAEYNANKVVYNGAELDIRGRPMVSVVKENEENAANYMPVRGVLGAMGYGVAWDSANGSVLVFTEEYLETSEDWIDFEDVHAAIDEKEEQSGNSYVAERITFDPDMQAVHVSFDAKHDWYITTAVADGHVYVERNGINNAFNWYGVPFFYSRGELAATAARREEFDRDPNAFVETDVLSALVNLDDNGPLTVVHAFNSDDVVDPGVFELRLNSDDSTVAALELFYIDGVLYLRKADVNPYLIEYGYGAVE